MNSGASESPAAIDFQSSHDRGIDHLTADLAVGDVAVYQTGTWYVDGVAVGDGTPPAWAYCLVDGLQIVWSHNCEHGVVRGFALQPLSDDQDETTTTRRLQVVDWDDMIDFGPEQLVARIPVQQESEDTFCALTVPLSDDLWAQQLPTE